MKRTTAFLAVIAFCAMCCSTAYAVWDVSDEGTWPESWPKELEPLRKQSRSLIGGEANLIRHEITFINQKEFEAAWPHILKVKSKGAPLILVRGPNKHMGKLINAGVVIHCPPAQTGNRDEPAAPLPGTWSDARMRWTKTTFIELVVDGNIVDLNRIPLPANTPIIDERFKDGQNKSLTRSRDNTNAPASAPASAPPVSTSQQKKTTAAPKPVPRFYPGTCVGAMACSLDGKLIAVGNDPATNVRMSGGRSKVADNRQPSVRIVDAKTLKPVVSLKLTTNEEDAVFAATEPVPHFEVKALAFSPDGKLLAVGTSVGQVKLFNARTGELVRSLDDEKAKLADKKTPKKWTSLNRAMGSVASLTFSPDGSLLAACGRSFDDFSSVFDGGDRLRESSSTDPGRLKVWEVKTGTLKHDLVGHTHATTVAFSPDGSLLASAGNWLTGGKYGTGAILWNPQTGAQIRTMTTIVNGGTHAVAFSPSGKLVVIGWRPFDRPDDIGDNEITVFDTSSGDMTWQRTYTGLAKPVVFMSGAYDSCIMALCHGEFYELAAQKDKGGTVYSAMHPVDYKEGTRWTDFAMAPQGWRLAVHGVTKDKQDFLEVVDFGSPRPAANPAAAKDGKKQDGKQGADENGGHGK